MELAIVMVFVTMLTSVSISYIGMERKALANAKARKDALDTGINLLYRYGTTTFSCYHYNNIQIWQCQ